MSALKALPVLALLAGCSAKPPPPPVPAAHICQPPVPVPVPPAKPRTVESIARWANETERALRLANRRLAECAGEAQP